MKLAGTLRNCAVVLALAVLVGCGAGGEADSPVTPTEGGTITIDNVSDGEKVSYPLLIVTGTTSGDASSVEVSVNGGSTREWRVLARRFKAVAPLTPGPNRIQVHALGHAATVVSVTHGPRAAETHRVRLVYLLTRDGDGSFQNFIPGEANDLATAVRRLRLNGRLLQAAYAEMLRRAGRGRKTFEFTTHDDGDIVFTQRFHLTEADVDQVRLVCERGTCEDGPPPYRSTYYLWGEVASAMGDTTDVWTTKNLVYMAFTRFDKDEAGGRSLLRGGGTLGGGSTATVHGNALTVFPENLDELQQRLFDRRRERDYGMNDVGQPGVEFWQAWAGSLGGAGHELGHSFGLGHASDHLALMTRGFDVFNRLFSACDGDGNGYPADELPFFPPYDEEGKPHLGVLDASAWLN